MQQADIQPIQNKLTQAEEISAQIDAINRFENLVNSISANGGGSDVLLFNESNYQVADMKTMLLMERPDIHTMLSAAFITALEQKKTELQSELDAITIP